MTRRRPFLSLLIGFAWVYAMVSVSGNRDRIEASLSAGSLTTQMQQAIFTGLVGVLMVSGVLLVFNLARAITHGGPRRSNSMRLMAGAGCACTLIFTPPEVIDSGLGLLDGEPRQLLEMAHATMLETMPGVDLGQFALLTSDGQ